MQIGDNESIVEHLLKRNFDPSRYVNQSITDDTLTVYLSNLYSKFLGYQVYNPHNTSKKANNPRDGRYFTYLPKNQPGCWGLEVLDRRKPHLYVVEGVFKASTLHMLGRNAIAVLGSKTGNLQEWLWTMGHYYQVSAIGDDDEAGREFVKDVGSGFCTTYDVDEMDLETLDDLLRDFEHRRSAF